MNQTRAKRGNVIAGLLIFSVIVLGIFLLFWDGFIIRLNTADYIQIAIFIALVWYSIETHLLRMWQKKQAQITLLSLDMQRVKNGAETCSNPTPYGKPFPTIVREIYELGKFDPKILYSQAFHQPISLKQRTILWIKDKLSYLIR